MLKTVEQATSIMPMKLEELPTGHYVLYVITFMDNNLSFTGYHYDEKVAYKLRNHLQQHISANFCMATDQYVHVHREVVIEDGLTFLSFTGRKYQQKLIQKSIEWIDELRKKAPDDDWILAIFGQHPKIRRPRWQRVLIDMSCLCCCIDKSVVVPF